MGVKKIESAQKFIQVEVDLKHMQTKFGGHGLSSFGDFVLFMILRKWPKFPFGPWGQKIESAQKFMQVEVDTL